MSIKRTLRERKFIKAYIETSGNATKAYMAIKPDISEESAAVLGYRMLRKVKISVSELLDEMGMNDTVLNKKLEDGLDANKVISVIPLITKKSQENSTDLPDANSKNIEFIDVPDFNVRFKYLDMAYKLKDKYPAEKHQVDLPKDLKIKVKFVE